MRRSSLGLACLTSLIATTAFADAPLRLNEIRLEQPGADLDEYIELACAPGESLAGLSVIVIGDDDLALPGQQNGVIEMVVGLGAAAAPASGYFVIGEPTLSLAAPNLATSLNLEGGDNLTVLLVRDFTGSLGQKLDTDDNGVLDLTPWSSIVSSLAVVATASPDGTTSDFFYSTTTVGPDQGLQPAAAWRCANTAQWNVGTVDPFAGVDSPGVANQTCVPTGVIINEIRMDQSGADYDEYFELKGGAGTDLSDLTYIVIGDGSATQGSGFVEAVVSLAGRTIGGTGYFVVAEQFTDVNGTSTVAIGVADVVLTGTNPLNYENTDNTTHLLVRNFTGAINTDLDTNNDGVLDITPWSEIVDSVANINPTAAGTQELVYSPVTVGPDGTFWAGHIYRCSPTGAWSIGTFSIADVNEKDSPKAVNPDCTTCGNGAGNCHAVHPTPGCVDVVCCTSVCGIDPTCCSEGWDQVCVDTARAQCLTAGSAPAVTLNEIRLDEPTSTDPNEYVEIKGTPGASLNGVSLVILGDGADLNGVVEAVVSLNGLSIPKDGIFLLAESTFTLGVADGVKGLNLENGDTVTYCLVFNFLGLNNLDYDANNDCTLDSQPWDTLIDSVTIRAGDGRCGYSASTVGPDYFGLPAHVVKCADGSWGFGRFDPAAVDGYGTPGTANTTCPLPYACGNAKGPTCYAAHAGVGCADESCCTAICRLDITCCEVAWDASCADQATLLCFVPKNPPAVGLSEIRIDQAGFDVDEYFELAGEPGTLLNGLTYIVIGDGSTTQGSGVIEFVQGLQGNVIPEDGFFLAARSTLTLGGATPNLVLPTTPEFENSDNVTHLLVFKFTGAIGQDLDTDDDGTLDVTPWTSINQSVAFLESDFDPPVNTEYAYGDVRVGPDPSGFVPSQLAYCPSTDAWTIGVFDVVLDPSLDSPGVANVGCTYSTPCPADLNADGVVSAADLAVLLGAWGTAGADLNGDGITSASDLAVLLGAWGACP